jgi:hypothetical protein
MKYSRQSKRGKTRASMIVFVARRLYQKEDGTSINLCVPELPSKPMLKMMMMMIMLPNASHTTTKSGKKGGNKNYYKKKSVKRQSKLPLRRGKDIRNRKQQRPKPL